MDADKQFFAQISIQNLIWNPNSFDTIETKAVIFAPLMNFHSFMWYTKVNFGAHDIGSKSAVQYIIPCYHFRH